MLPRTLLPPAAILRRCRRHRRLPPLPFPPLHRLPARRYGPPPPPPAPSPSPSPARSFSSSSSSSSPPSLSSPLSPPPRHHEIVRDRHYINGSWTLPSHHHPSTSSSSPSSRPTHIDVYDSNTGLTFASVPSGTSADAIAAVESASDAFRAGISSTDGWSLPSSLPRRMEAVRSLADAYEVRRVEVGELLRRELGAPGRFAIDVQAATLGYLAANFLDVAGSYDWTVDLGGDGGGGGGGGGGDGSGGFGSTTEVWKEPVGVVAAITPWNWPIHQIGAKVLPALLAGCSVVLKPSEVTPLNAFVLADAVREVEGTGLMPPGMFNLVCGTGSDVGETLASHPLVDMVSFTGSTAAGRRVHELGSRTVKRVRSELGGKSAAVVLDDFDDAGIVREFALNALENSGQSCNALSRMLAPMSRYDEVVDIVKDEYRSVRVVRADDPTAGEGDIGPLASKEQMERVRGYIRSGIDEGATLVLGGLDDGALPPDLPDGGYFVPPTVFADVRPEMTIAREEIFGPVVCVIPYSDVDDAVRIANDTVYGLSGGVIGGGDDGGRRAFDVARRLRTGEVFVNTLGPPSPGAPFGGYSQSGDGREMGLWGFEEFLEVKAVHRRRRRRR